MVTFSPIADGVESLISAMEDHLEAERKLVVSHLAALQDLKMAVFVIEAQRDAGLVDDDPEGQMRKYRAAVDAVVEILYDTEPAECSGGSR